MVKKRRTRMKRTQRAKTARLVVSRGNTKMRKKEVKKSRRMRNKATPGGMSLRV